MNNLSTATAVTAAAGKKFKPVAAAAEQLTREEKNTCDIALADYLDIINPRFYAWYCKAWYIVGENKFHELAAQARADGKYPARLFSSLLKKELNKPAASGAN